MTPKTRIGLAAFVSSLGLDLVTKYLIIQNLSFSDRIPVIDGFFYLTHIRLTFFVGVACIAIAIIISFFRKLAPGDRLASLALGLILGGAIGNLIDRIRFQEVVDFLHFRLWAGYTWPDFNVADSCIVVGVGVLVLELLASEGETRAESAASESPGSS